MCSSMLYLLVFCLLCVAQAMPPKLIWTDTFDVLDTDTWTHLVTGWDGGNQEFQYYRNHRKNSFAKDGFLHIRPTFTADEFGEEFLYNGTLAEPNCNFSPCTIQANGKEIVPPIFSARISTVKSFSFKYGRVEVRAKMPRGDWIWPAIWLMPESDKTYGVWPSGGEIDMVEIRSNPDYKDQNNNPQGITKVSSTLHFGTTGNDLYYYTNFDKVLTNGDFSDDFHTFELVWGNSTMRFLVDGKVMAEVTPPDGGFWELARQNPANNPYKQGTRMAPFDHKFYLILNVAVGGRFFPDGWVSNGKPRPWDWAAGTAKKEFWNARKEWQKTWDRPEMIVDHILVYSWE